MKRPDRALFASEEDLATFREQAAKVDPAAPHLLSGFPIEVTPWLPDGTFALVQDGRVQLFRINPPEEPAMNEEATTPPVAAEAELARATNPVAVQAPAAEPMLQWFKYDHLPTQYQQTSAAFSGLADFIVATLPRNAERTVALRKLLESLDAGRRAGVSQ